MKKNINHLITIAVTILLSCMMSQVWAAQSKNKMIVKGKLPQGIVIKNNQITLKKGYYFEKVSKSRVNIMARTRGGTGITGSFDCTCNGESGGCDVITTPTSVSCATSTCKSSCYMITTIPGSQVHGYLYMNK